MAFSQTRSTLPHTRNNAVINVLTAGTGTMLRDGLVRHHWRFGLSLPPLRLPVSYNEPRSASASSLPE